MVNLEFHLSSQRMKFFQGREIENFRYTPIDDYNVGSNADTDYIPWFSLFRREYIKDTKDTYVYNKPAANITTLAHLSQYTDLFHYLNYRDYVGGVFSFTVAGETHRIIIFNGYILDTNFNSLMMLTVKDYYSLEPDNCRILVSPEFMTNPIYKNVWKKIETDFIGDAFKKDIEVITISSKKIDQRVFCAKPPIVYDNLTDLAESMLGLNRFFRAESFHPSIYVRGMNVKVKPLFNDEQTIANLMITNKAGELQVPLLKDLTDSERIEDTLIFSVELNKFFRSFEEFVKYAYTHCLGGVFGFSIETRWFRSGRTEFTLNTVTNSLFQSVHQYNLEVVDYDVLAEYNRVQEESVQENVNFGDEVLPDTLPF